MHRIVRYFHEKPEFALAEFFYIHANDLDHYLCTHELLISQLLKYPTLRYNYWFCLIVYVHAF